MSLALQPGGSWVRLDIIAGSPDVVRLSATRPWPDPDDYYGGFKRGEIMSLGDVARALSDRSGSPTVARFSYELWDKLGDLRELLVSAVYLTSQDVTFYLASEQAHDLAVLADPRLGFRGQILRATPRPQRRFLVDAESRIGTKFGPFNLDGPVLKRAYTTTDFPSLPREAQNTAVPFLWGELSDFGTVNADNVDVAQGMVIPTNCGLQTAPQDAVYLDPPPAPTYTVTSNQSPWPNGSTTWSFACVVRTITGGRTTLGAALTIDNLPSSADGFDTSNYLTLFLAHYDAALDTHVFGPGGGIDLYVKKGQPDSSYPWKYVDAAGQMFNTSPGDPFVGGVGFDIDGDDSFNKPWNPPPSSNTALIADAEESYYWFNLLGHEGHIVSLYGLALDVVSESGATYAEITAGEQGVTFGDADILTGAGGDGITRVMGGHTYFGFWARGPRAEAHINGTAPFRVNLCGWHDEGMGSPALLIDKAGRVYQDVFVQLQGGTNGEGYQTGARLTIPSFRSAPAVPILQSSTFEAVQDVAGTEMSGGSPVGSPADYGPKATVYFDSFETTWRSFMEGMNRTFFWDTGENHHGQTILAMMPATVDPNDGLWFREFIDVRRVENAGEPEPEQIENVVRYAFDRAPIGGVYRSGILTLRDETSIAGYGGERTSDSVRELPYTRDPATAAWSVGKYLADRAIAPAYPVVVTKLRKGVIVELGAQFWIEHSDIGPDPIAVYCREHTLSVARGEVRLAGRARLVPTSP